ncbi:MAG: tetratricopeptide repeat protein [Nanoarchaeota archaeon]
MAKKNPVPAKSREIDQARSDLKEGRLDEALSKAMALGEDADALALIGDVFAQKSEASRAVSAYKKSLRVHDAAAVRRKLGSLYLTLKMFGLAEDHLVAAVELDPSSVDAFRDLARAQFMQKRFSQAIATAKAALGATGNKEFADLVAKFEERIPGLKAKYRTIEEYEERIAADPHDVNAYTSIADYYLSRQDFFMAQSWLQRCVDVNPKYVGAYLNLGAYYHKRKHFGKVVEVLESAMLIKTDDVKVTATILTNMAIACLGMDDFKRARMYLDKAMDLDPPNKEFILSLYQQIQKE